MPSAKIQISYTEFDQTTIEQQIVPYIRRVSYRFLTQIKTRIYVRMSFKRYIISPLVDTLVLLKPLRCLNGITTSQDIQQTSSNISKTAAYIKGARRLVRSLIDCSFPCPYPSDASNILLQTLLPAFLSPRDITLSIRLSTGLLRSATTSPIIRATKVYLQKPQRGSLSGTSSDSTACPTLLYQTVAYSSS